MKAFRYAIWQKKKKLPQIKFVQFYKIGPVEYLANIVQLEEQLVT